MPQQGKWKGAVSDLVDSPTRFAKWFQEEFKHDRVLLPFPAYRRFLQGVARRTPEWYQALASIPSNWDGPYSKTWTRKDASVLEEQVDSICPRTFRAYSDIFSLPDRAPGVKVYDYMIMRAGTVEKALESCAAGGRCDVVALEYSPPFVCLAVQFKEEKVGKRAKRCGFIIEPDLLSPTAMGALRSLCSQSRSLVWKASSQILRELASAGLLNKAKLPKSWCELQPLYDDGTKYASLDDCLQAMDLPSYVEPDANVDRDLAELSGAWLLLDLWENFQFRRFTDRMVKTIPIDTKMRAGSLELRGAFVSTVKALSTSYTVSSIRDRFDVLLVGHSNLDLASPGMKRQLIRNLYKEAWFLGKKWPPLCNDIGLYHPDDIMLDIFGGYMEQSKVVNKGEPPKDMRDVLPIGHFTSIATVFCLCTNTRRLIDALKPGGQLAIFGAYTDHERQTKPEFQKLASVLGQPKVTSIQEGSHRQTVTVFFKPKQGQQRKLLGQPQAIKKKPSTAMKV